MAKVELKNNDIRLTRIERESGLYSGTLSGEVISTMLLRYSVNVAEPQGEVMLMGYCLWRGSGGYLQAVTQNRPMGR